MYCTVTVEFVMNTLFVTIIINYAGQQVMFKNCQTGMTHVNLNNKYN